MHVQEVLAHPRAAAQLGHFLWDVLAWRSCTRRRALVLVGPPSVEGRCLLLALTDQAYHVSLCPAPVGSRAELGGLPSQQGPGAAAEAPWEEMGLRCMTRGCRHSPGGAGWCGCCEAGLSRMPES